jgi:hypothetical protein
MNSYIRIAATQYSLGTWFVSGIQVLIPCIKEKPRIIIIQRQCMNRKILRCNGIKHFTQTENLQQIRQIQQLKTDRLAISSDRNVVPNEAEKKLNTRV